MIGFELTAEQQRLKGVARELAQDFARRADVHDRERSAPVENFALLREAGFYGMVVPREYGGLGGKSLEYGLVVEELAQGCAATMMAFSMHICATGVLFHGSDLAEDRRRALAELVLAQGKLLCASASETGGTGHALHTLIPQGRAERDGDGYRIHARKAFCTNFEAADYCLLYLHPGDDPDPEVSMAVLVDTKARGIEVNDVWDTLGMRATRSNEVVYDGAFVPDAGVVARGKGLFLGTLARSGAYFHHVFAQTYLGLGLGMLAFAKDYLAGRVPRGYQQPMAYHPAARRRIGELAAGLEAARAITHQTSFRHDRDGPSPDVQLAMLKAKVAVARAVGECVASLPICCGANALFYKHPLARMLRDAVTANVMPPNLDVALDMTAMGEMQLDPAAAMPPLTPAS